MAENETAEGVLAKRHSAKAIISEVEYSLLTGRGKVAAATNSPVVQKVRITSNPNGNRVDLLVWRQWFSHQGEPVSLSYRIFPTNDPHLPASLREISREEDRWIKSCRLADAPSYSDFAFFCLEWAAARTERRRIIKRNPATPRPQNLGERYRSEDYAEVYYSFLMATKQDDEHVLGLNDFGPDDNFGPLSVKAGGY